MYCKLQLRNDSTKPCSYIYTCMYHDVWPKLEWHGNLRYWHIIQETSDLPENIEILYTSLWYFVWNWFSHCLNQLPLLRQYCIINVAKKNFAQKLQVTVLHREKFAKIKSICETVIYGSILLRVWICTISQTSNMWILNPHEMNCKNNVQEIGMILLYSGLNVTLVHLILIANIIFFKDRLNP